MTLQLSIVIPIFNEEDLLPELFSRLERTRSLLRDRCHILLDEQEILFVNDGSKDKTFILIREFCSTHKGYRLINLSRNFGHQLAISAGMNYATGEFIVIMDGDLQDPPEFIVELYLKCNEGFDVVYATRDKREGESIFKRMTASAFYRLIKSLVSFDIPMDTGDFRIMSKRMVAHICSMPESHRFIRGMVSWVGFAQTGISYHRDKRYAGTTKFSLRKMMRFAFDGITSFSALPLKFASYLGFIMAFLGLVYFLYILYLKLFTTQTIQGWSSLMLLVLIVSGVQLITLGVIGEYVGRIYDESKKRPLFIIEGIYPK